MFSKIAGLPRRVKILLMLMCDVVLLPLALWSSIALRMGTWSPPVSSYLWLFFVVPFVTVPIFIKIGLYRAIIRYLDDKIIYTVFCGVTLSVLLLTAVVLMGRVAPLPRSSVVIYWIMGIAYIASSRFIARGLMRSLETMHDRRQSVAIYGAGRAGLQTVLALLSSVEFKPVAIFDDNKELHGSNVAGVRVFDSKEAFAVMKAKDCRQLLMAMPSASRQRRKEIIQHFEGKDITLKTIPGMGELVDGRVRIEDIRDVGVEDLLGRDPVPPYEELISACVAGRTVMVTGAGGSIGSELCRQIIQNSPQRLILYEQNEFALYKIEQDLRRHKALLELVPVLGNVLDEAHLEKVVRRYGVSTIYHAAAYKHVPLVESNISAGVENNVLGTLTAARVAIRSNVSNFVLISTDKAVRPTNIMGASKRLAELVLQALSTSEAKATRFSMVRFGNVLGSSGSVVPLFKEQIRAGGPITVTHPDVTRYFMTIPEAAQLVMQAGAMGQGGDVFVLDMGEPVKIADLAAKMIQLSGLEVRDSMTGAGDVAIEFIGLRPGEKLFEELLIGGGSIEKTLHPRILRAVEGMLEPEYLFARIEQMRDACIHSNDDLVQTLIKELVEEYRPANHQA
ncbi:MAG: polysaccharide biosynthesis protein [Bdellovibrio sp.]